MLLTLKELAQRIKRVRRAIDDRSGLAVVRICVNGTWIEATRDSVKIDDSGAISITTDTDQHTASESVDETLLGACEAVANGGDWLEFVAQLLEARNQCITAIAAAGAQAEDDATPADEVWVADQAGWCLDHPGMVRLVTRNVSLEYQAWPSGKTTLNIFGRPVIDSPTRGDFRRLLDALGVEN